MKLTCIASWLSLCAPAAADGAHPFSALIERPQPARLEAARRASSDGSPAGLVELWLLAHDPDHEVVGAALESTLARCARAKDEACLASLTFFMDAEVEDGPQAFRARTTLLAERPELARAYASRQSKLDVVAVLAGRLGQGFGAKPWVSALELLSQDEEPEVQEAASAVLLQVEH